LFALAKAKSGGRISVSAAHDEHVLEAVHEAKKMGLADFTLIGDEVKIKAIAETFKINLADFEVIHEADVAASCIMAVKLVSEGKAHAVMKGLCDTSVIMKAALNKEAGIRTGNLLSHLAAFKVPSYPKLLFVTDAAINIAPDYQAKRHILQNAITAVQNLGIPEPKAALLAAKEKADEKMPVTLEYVKLVAEAKAGGFKGAIIDGPLALDNAVSREACAIKGINSPVGGEADILFCPDIEAGNILYKALNFLAAAQSGGVVVGAKRPVILTSRADSVESKLISIALGVLF